MRMLLAVTLALTPMIAKDTEPASRLAEAAAVFSEIMATPDKGIPQDLLERAHCVVIVPNLKTAAFMFGAKYGKGYMSCRKAGGEPERRSASQNAVQREPLPHAAAIVSKAKTSGCSTYLLRLGGRRTVWLRSRPTGR